MPTGTILYEQRPKPYSAALELTLGDTHFVAVRGKSRHEMPLSAVERIRLRFTPKNSVFRAFTCEVRARDGRSVRFENVSWKSLIETERQDQDYVRLVRTLIARSAAANPKVELVAGITRFKHMGMVVIGGSMMIAFIGCIVYAAMQGNLVVTLMALGLAAYLGFWMKEFAVRNRPRTFKAGEIPTDIIPG